MKCARHGISIRSEADESRNRGERGRSAQGTFCILWRAGSLEPVITKTVQYCAPGSWRQHEARHMPRYSDAAAFARVESELQGYPPLVFAGEERELKSQRAQVAAGKAFLLQGGDCAHSFAAYLPNQLRHTFLFLLPVAAHGRSPRREKRWLE